MDLKGLVSIPGKPGLYRIVSQVKSATLVESLIDNSKFPIYMSDKGAQLEPITILAGGKEVKLTDIMDIIYKKESGGTCIDSKSEPKLIAKYFEEILPTYDKSKVYTSDIRKILQWYNFLQSKGLLKFNENKEEKTNEESSTEKPADETADNKENKE